MELKIKDKYLDDRMSCPYTGQVHHLRFLEKSMYKFWFNKLPWLFEEEDPNKPKAKYIKLDK